jgi:hypothetical protein
MAPHRDDTDLHRTLPALRARLLRCAALTVAVGTASLSVGSATALADGGPTIAAATPVAYGQLESGSTATGGASTDGSGGSESYWALPVTNGDDVTIDWQAPLDGAGNGPVLSAYEIGTNDGNVVTAAPFASDTLGTNGQDEMVFTADATGVMVLQFESGEGGESAPGPYQFTASVSHAVALAVPTVSNLTAKGTLAVGVANPDAAGVSDSSLAVSVQIQDSGSSWTTIGTASPAGGQARIAYTVPAAFAGKTVKLQVVAQGAAYQTQTSESQSVAVAATGSGTGSVKGGGSGTGTGSGHGAHAGVACVVPSLVGKKLGRAKLALADAGCRIGHVRRARGRHTAHGRVIHQSVSAGAHVRRGARVNLVVGR